jgi:hypothetical protein
MTPCWSPMPTDKIWNKDKLKDISPKSWSHEIKPFRFRYVFLHRTSHISSVKIFLYDRLNIFSEVHK